MVNNITDTFFMWKATIPHCFLHLVVKNNNALERIEVLAILGNNIDFFGRLVLKIQT
jgi:hypothetical protein